MGATETFLCRALALEREAADRYSEFEAWLESRELPSHAARCRNLAMAHRERCAEIGGEPAPGTRTPWMSAEGREAFYQLAAPRQLLEVALDAELDALRFYERTAAMKHDEQTLRLASILAAHAMRCVGEVVAAIDEAAPVDWEAVISLGGGPGLALGAERRLRMEVR